MEVNKNSIKSFRANETTKVIAYQSGNLEIVETCDINSGKLFGRKQREKSISGTTNTWEWIYGAPQESNDKSTIVDGSQNPIFMRFDSDSYFQWYVKKIPYPADTYEINVNEDKNNFVIKTKNKKYFKIVHPPSNIKLKKSLLEWTWSKNTLIIRYPKTEEDIKREDEERKYRLSIPIEEVTDPNCRI